MALSYSYTQINKLTAINTVIKNHFEQFTDNFFILFSQMSIKQFDSIKNLQLEVINFPYLMSQIKKIVRISLSLQYLVA